MDGSHGKGSHEATEHIASETPREQNVRYVFHLVIPNKKGDCVLGEVLSSGILRLPKVEMPAGFSCSDPWIVENEVESEIEGQLGICGCLVEYLLNGVKKQIHTASGVEEHEIFLMDILNEECTDQKGFEWIREEVACKNEWVRTNGDTGGSHVHEVIKGVFEKIKVESAVGRDDGWNTLGWYEKVLLWTRDVLKEKNMVMDGRLRQRMRGIFSCVMTCKVKKRERCVLTRSGRHEEIGTGDCSEIVYVKGGIPVSREGRRTATIGAVIGSIVPEVLGVNEKEGVMVQRDGGTITDGAFDQEALINTVLKMQELSMNRINELEAGGMEILDSEWLESNIGYILKHELLDAYREYDEFGSIAGLRSREEAIKERCRKITSLCLPRTIVHGDLRLDHVGRPLIGEGKMYQLFDWGMSFIGSPLHDFESLLVGTWPSTDFPEHSIDYETAVKQVCGRWMPGTSIEELKLIFEALREMSNLFWIYSLTKEYDACDGPLSDGRDRVLAVLDDVLALG